MATDGTYGAFANGTIGLVDPNAGPTPSTIAGSAGARCTTRPRPAVTAAPRRPRPRRPTGLAVGLDGSLYIADPALPRVRRIAPNGTISTVAGTGQACTGTAGCGDGGSAVAAQLADPQGVSVDPAGQIYIADGTRGVRRVGLDGTIATVASGAYDVVSVTGDASGAIWAAANDPDYLLEVNVTVAHDDAGRRHGDQRLQRRCRLARDRGAGQPAGEPLGDAGRARRLPDTGNHLIRAYDPAFGTVIDDIAGIAGTGGYNGDGRDAQHTQLNAPRAVAATRGALYVVGDTGNGRVRQVGPSAVSSSPGTEEPGAQPGSPTRPSVTSRPVVRRQVVSGGAPRSPGARVRPDYRFTVGSVRVRRDGTVTLRVKVRAAGRLRGVVTIRRNGRTSSFATGAAGIRNPTTVTLRATPTKRARELLGRGPERLRLALAVTFRPTGGDARTVAVRGLSARRVLRREAVGADERVHLARVHPARPGRAPARPSRAAHRRAAPRATWDPPDLEAITADLCSRFALPSKAPSTPNTATTDVTANACRWGDRLRHRQHAGQGTSARLPATRRSAPRRQLVARAQRPGRVSRARRRRRRPALDC